MIRRIMRRMAEMRDMYKMTKFVESEAYMLSINTDTPKTPLELRGTLAKLYAKTDDIQSVKAMKLVNRAESNGYIRIIGNGVSGMYDITDQGHHLIGKQLGIFRVGLWDESLKHYDTTKTVVVSILVSGTVATIIGFIIGRI